MFCCRRDPYKDSLQVVIKFQDDEIKTKPPTLRKISNAVRTSKYANIFSWLIFSLLYQFKRAANVYFLFISILTFFQFSPKTTWSMVGTFGAILIFSMFKELYEDWGRRREDRQKNKGSIAHKYNQNRDEFQQISWMHLRVGDVVRLKEGKQIPADILILYSEDKDFHVYADTKNLDGEVRPTLKRLKILRISIQTNSKQYSCTYLKLTSKQQFVDRAKSLKISQLTYGKPNEKLDQFKCQFQDKDGLSKILKIDNILLRGSVLRKYQCIGMVMYTGHDTKIMKNSKAPPHKISNMIKLMNYMLMSIFLLQIIFIIILAVLSQIWRNDHKEHDYFQGDKYGSSSAIISILVFWVAYSHMIPISLYVIVQILKIIQKFTIQWDEKLMDEDEKKAIQGNMDTDVYSYSKDQAKQIDKIRAKVRNSDLVEQLGQITHIFTDKTGTLTKNQLKYMKSYYLRQQGEQKVFEQAFEHKPNNFNLLLNMLLNHSIQTENGDSYVGKSSDQISLLQQARDSWNIKFLKQQNMAVIDLFGSASSIQINHNQQIKKRTIKGIYKPDGLDDFDIYHTIQFDSQRKRMSVIVKLEDDKYILLVKGADSQMKFAHQPRELKNRVKDYAKEGLRTLVFGHRFFDQKEYKNILLNQINDIENGDDQASQHAKDSLESQLQFSGLVAIQDKLQDGVERTLKNLSESNIRIWVLTGDKLETATQIGRSCGLLSDGKVYQISDQNSKISNFIKLMIYQ